MRTSLFLLPLCFSLLACSGVHGSTRSTWDNAGLNQVWYGAYHRPIARTSRPAAPAPAVAAVSAPASTPASRPAPPPSAANTSVAANDSILAAAFVRDTYTTNETPIGDGPMLVVDLYRHVHEHGEIYHRGRPAVGDMVFFHNTYDQNGDQRPNDWYTHVGIVESVDANETVTVLQFSGGSINRIKLNREHAAEPRLDGEVINTEIRPRRSGDPPHSQYLAGELFAGYGSLLGDRLEVYVLDVWSPEDSDSLRASR